MVIKLHMFPLTTIALHKCDSVLHILQHPRNVSLDKETNLRQSSLSNMTAVQPSHILLMKPAPLSVSHSIGSILTYLNPFVKRQFYKEILATLKGAGGTTSAFLGTIFMYYITVLHEDT